MRSSGNGNSMRVQMLDGREEVVSECVETLYCVVEVKGDAQMLALWSGRQGEGAGNLSRSR